MSGDSGIFDDPAEEQLRSALMNLLKGMSQGPTITHVHSYGLAEDGETFVVSCRLPDGTLAIWTFAQGQPVQYSVHDVGMPGAPDATAQA